VAAIIFIPVIVFCLFSSVKSAELANMMPLYPSSSFLQSPKFYSGLFAFSGFLFLGFIRPHIRLEAVQKRNYLLLYVIAIVPLYLISIYFPLLIFGQETVSRFIFPVIEAMETIDLYWLMFERVTIFYVTVTLCFVILSAALLIWISALILQKLYVPVSRNKLAAGVALVCYIVGCLIPSWNALELISLLDTGFRLYCILLFPCLLGILALILKRRETLA
jgi:hypothetical protein